MSHGKNFVIYFVPESDAESERVCGGACFLLQTETSLFLFELQVFTMNRNEGFCDGVYSAICY